MQRLCGGLAEVKKRAKPLSWNDKLHLLGVAMVAPLFVIIPAAMLFFSISASTWTDGLMIGTFVSMAVAPVSIIVTFAMVYVSRRYSGWLNPNRWLLVGAMIGFFIPYAIGRGEPFALFLAIMSSLVGGFISLLTRYFVTNYAQ